MGSTLLRRTILNSFVPIALFVFVISCPEPRWLPIEFKENSKRTKTYRTSLDNIGCRLAIKGGHTAHRDNSALVKVSLKLNFRKGFASQYKIVLNAPKLIFEDVVLPYESLNRTQVPDSHTTQLFVAPFPGGDPDYLFRIDS